ncbi:DUF7504 family protein [Natronorubrum sp. DTA7]|uniref:DUF7504 family protein n=1 Tax=Natronorubrum sp. DTA7 TaxID=3447016 RepID=UPI003F8271A1
MTKDTSRDGRDQFPHHRGIDGGMQMRSGVAVVKRIADETGVSPMELPQLNETVDPDALDALHDSVRGSNRGAGAVVTFSYANRRVRITADGRVTTSSPDEPPATDDWPHVSDVDVARENDAAVRIVSAVAAHTDHDRTYVRSAIADTIDLDAVVRLNERRRNGTPRSGATVAFSTLGYDVVVRPDGTIAAGSTLRRLKRVGGNVLVVGAVPDDLVDVASTRLLGNCGRDRCRLFALLDRDIDAVCTRLSPGDASTAHVVDYAATARSAASAQPGVDTETMPSIVSEPDDIDALEEAIDSTLRTITAAETESSPATTRLCVDSLRPIIEDRDIEVAERFLESVCGSVKAVSALGHYVLPIERSSDAVRRLEALFDATVELRVGEFGAEQRWHLHESDYTTDWFALRDSR